MDVATAEDFPAIHRLLDTAFHSDHDPARVTVREVFEPERSLVARDGGTMVAHAGAFTRDLTVPGAVLPAAHVTMVAVAPTHRRQGLFTRLAVRQLRDVHAAGAESVAVLWASEGRIYPRFGYGLAAYRLDLDVDLTEVGPPREERTDTVDRLHLVEPTTAVEQLATVYEQVHTDRPGWSSRGGNWWRVVLDDPPDHRQGATGRRAVLHEGPDGVDGYALWRVKSDWTDGSPNARTIVDEVVAGTRVAYRALWRMLLSIDLSRRLSYPFAAVDEPLLRLVDEPRRLGGRLVDALWLRLVDVPAALSGRRYATDVDVVIDVADPLLPDNTGRWRLTGGPEGAECVPTYEPAQLACDVRDLAELYLGGGAPMALADAGRLRELRPGVLARIAPAFGWYRAPAGMGVF